MYNLFAINVYFTALYPCISLFMNGLPSMYDLHTDIQTYRQTKAMCLIRGQGTVRLTGMAWKRQGTEMQLRRLEEVIVLI